MSGDRENLAAPLVVNETGISADYGSMEYNDDEPEDYFGSKSHATIPETPPVAIAGRKYQNTVPTRKSRIGLMEALKTGKAGSFIQRFFNLTVAMRLHMVTNIIVLILITYLTVSVTDNDAGYMRNVRGTMKRTFIPGIVETEQINWEFSDVFLYTYEEAVSHVKKSVTRFYTFNDTNPDRWYYYRTDAGGFEPVLLYITSYTDPDIFEHGHSHSRKFNTATTVYELTVDDPLGPLNATTSTLQDTFELLYDMKLKMRIVNPSFTTSDTVVNRVWVIELKYDFQQRGGRILVESVINCDELQAPDTVLTLVMQPRRVLLDSVIVIFSFCALVVSFFAISNSFSSYQEHIHIQTKVSWFHLRFSDMLSSMGLWFVLNFFCMVLNIVGCAMEIAWLLGRLQEYKIFINLCTGMSCLLGWIHFLRYIEVMSAHRSILAVALRKGVMSLITFLIYAFPIFAGFALFGMRFFAESTVMFKSFDQAAVTLFSVLNGDIINDTFGAIASSEHMVSRIYLFVFIFLFIYACLNVFIVIMEDSFHLAKVYEKQYRNRFERYFNQKLWDAVLRGREAAKEVDMYDYIPSGDLPVGMDQPRRPSDSGQDVDDILQSIPDMTKQLREMEASQRRLLNDLQDLSNAHHSLSHIVNDGLASPG